MLDFALYEKYSALTWTEEESQETRAQPHRRTWRGGFRPRSFAPPLYEDECPLGADGLTLSQ